MLKLLKRLHCDQTGQGMAEYGLIIAVVALIALAGFKLLGGGISKNVNKAAEELNK
ncbi:MAG: Flp family type IVb pilin [Desulfocucumaceae bacterium]